MELWYMMVLSVWWYLVIFCFPFQVGRVTGARVSAFLLEHSRVCDFPAQKIRISSKKNTLLSGCGSGLKRRGTLPHLQIRSSRCYTNFKNKVFFEIIFLLFKTGLASEEGLADLFPPGFDYKTHLAQVSYWSTHFRNTHSYIFVDFQLLPGSNKDVEEFKRIRMAFRYFYLWIVLTCAPVHFFMILAGCLGFDLGSSPQSTRYLPFM